LDRFNVANLRWPSVSATSLASTLLDLEAQARDAQMEKGCDHLKAGNYYKGAQVFRKLLQADPGHATAHANLACALCSSYDFPGAAAAYLAAARCCEPLVASHKSAQVLWADSMSMAFDLLARYECKDVDRPSWWRDDELLELSARVVRLDPRNDSTWKMRGFVLSAPTYPENDYRAWSAAPRSMAQLEEAVASYEASARLTSHLESVHISNFKHAANVREVICARRRLEAIDAVRTALTTCSHT
jgi:tetratricopeptide (TPR) repeat protein